MVEVEVPTDVSVLVVLDTTREDVEVCAVPKNLVESVSWTEGRKDDPSRIATAVMPIKARTNTGFVPLVATSPEDVRQ